MWKNSAQQQMEAVASSFSSVQNHEQSGTALTEADVQELRDTAAKLEAESVQWRMEPTLVKELQCV